MVHGLSSALNLNLLFICNMLNSIGVAGQGKEARRFLFLAHRTPGEQAQLLDHRHAQTRTQTHRNTVYIFRCELAADLLLCYMCVKSKGKQSTDIPVHHRSCSPGSRHQYGVLFLPAAFRIQVLLPRSSYLKQMVPCSNQQPLNQVKQVIMRNRHSVKITHDSLAANMLGISV